MEKEYGLIKIYYISGEQIKIFVDFDFDLKPIVKRYNKLMRRKRRRYTCEIIEHSVTEWVNIDYDNVLGFN